MVLAGGDRDCIVDFEDGRDVIDLRGHGGIDGFAELRAEAVANSSAVTIDLGAAAGQAGGEDMVTVAGVVLAQLSASDFLFA